MNRAVAESAVDAGSDGAGDREDGPGAEVTEAELKEHVKKNLARYKVPREIRFLDQLPRNPTGKVLKRVLLES